MAHHTATSRVSVTTSGVLLAAASPERLGVTIKNTDATNPIYIQETNPATAATGFPLLAGESMTKTYDGAIYAISTGGTVAVAVDDESD